MEPIWFYSRNGQQFGPIPFAELKQLAMKGELLPSDLIWEQGSAGWAPASSNAELFAALPPPLPVIPTPSKPEPPLTEGIISLDELPVLDTDQGRRRENRRQGRRSRDDDYDDDRPRRERDGYEDYDDDDRPRRRKQVDPLAVIGLHLRRSFTPDIADVQATNDEDIALEESGIHDKFIRSYAVWRRSVLFVVLVPLFLAGILKFISSVMSEESTRGGILLDVIQALSLFAMPIAAGIAAYHYTQLARSSQALLIGGSIAFFVPLILSLAPASWRIDAKDSIVDKTASATLGLMLYVTLLPTVLALLPGLCRACMRVKILLPESIIPGWGILAAAPFYFLLGFLALVLFYHLPVGNFLLVFAMVAIVGAPMVYLTRAGLLCRPALKTRELRSLIGLQLYVLLVFAAGVIAFIIYLFTASSLGVNLVGFDSKKSLVRPWNRDLHAFWLEFAGRSMFMTVLFADLLMRMNLSIWQQHRTFAGSEKAEAYEKTMTTVAAAYTYPEAASRKRRHSNDDDDER